MKLSLRPALAIASITGLTLSGLVASSAVAATSPDDNTTVTAQSADALDVTAVRERFNEYVRQADLDAATRAQLEAVGVSDDVFQKAVAAELADLRATLRAAGIDGGMPGAINPDDYDCSTTDMTSWARAQLAGVEPSSWEWYNKGLLGISPALFLQYWTLMKSPTDPHDAEFGVDGADTNEMSRTFRALDQFWDIDDGEVALVPFDAKVFADTPEAVAERQFVYDRMTEYNPLAGVFMQLVVELALLDGMIDGFPGGVDNPMFTLNAFAIDPATAEGDAADMLAKLGVTRRIAMGAGLSQLWDGIGLGAVGNRAVLSHEYAHQVQYTHELFETDIVDKPEQTRRSELMADAFGTYFAVSKRGQSLNKELTLQAMQSFYTVGDCSFDNPGHHGTPMQRYRSAEWAVNFTKGLDDQGHVVPVDELSVEFEKVFPELIAPDAQ